MRGSSMLRETRSTKPHEITRTTTKPNEMTRKYILIVICILTTAFVRVTNAHGQQVVSNALAEDIRFASGNSALKIPFELYNNHIYLKVGVNGSKPLTFLLDTGAPHLIDTSQAKTLGLKLKPHGQGQGMGEGKVDTYTSQGVSFSLPGLSLSNQWVGVLSLDGVAVCASEIVADERGNVRKCEPNEQRCQRRVIDGVLGDDFFKRFVVEIDYDAGLMNVYAPAAYKYQGTGESIPLELTDRYSFVQVQLSIAGRAPVNGRFIIDTGNAQALILSRPFIEANRLLPPASELTKFAICGIGGYSETLIGTVSTLQLGNIKISEPVTGFAQAKSGNLADGTFEGNIGAGILRHFKVIFDYSRHRMILESSSKE
jgi:hypothetical protein